MKRPRDSPAAAAPSCTRLSRITLNMSHPRSISVLESTSAHADALLSYSVVAVRTGSFEVLDALLRSPLLHSHVDVIVIDCVESGGRPPFQLKPPLLARATAAGVVFQVDLSPALRGAAPRKGVCVMLAELARGLRVPAGGQTRAARALDALLLVSGASSALEQRSVRDYAALVVGCTAGALSIEDAVRCMTTVPAAVLARAAVRSGRLPQAVLVASGQQLEEEEEAAEAAEAAAATMKRQVQQATLKKPKMVSAAPLRLTAAAVEAALRGDDSDE